MWLQAFVTENPTSSALSSAMLAQLAADEGRVADAITAVNASPALAHQPATVAALTSLMDSTGDASGAFDVFHGAAAHWGAVATADGTSTKARTRALGNRAAVLRIGTEFMIKHVRAWGRWAVHLGGSAHVSAYHRTCTTKPAASQPCWWRRRT